MIWVITSPERLHEEAARINRLMTVADVLLLRKPGWTAGEYAVLLEQIHPRYRSRIMIAEQPALLQEYGLMGLHMSERTRQHASPAMLERYLALGVVLSTSIHQPECPGDMWGHLLLGPVFDSISKPGYGGRFRRYAVNSATVENNCNGINSAAVKGDSYTVKDSTHSLPMSNIPANAIAIGGVKAANVGITRAMGFSGAAVLGAIWQEAGDPVEIYQEIKAAWKCVVI